MRARNGAGFSDFSPRIYFQVAAAPQLINLRTALGALFQFDIVGATGVTCVVEASSNLLSWVPVATNYGASGSFTFSDKTASNGVAHFYRVAMLP
jgi:hypothetical protein